MQQGLRRDVIIGFGRQHAKIGAFQYHVTQFFKRNITAFFGVIKTPIEIFFNDSSFAHGLNAPRAPLIRLFFFVSRAFGD